MIVEAVFILWLQNCGMLVQPVKDMKTCQSYIGTENRKLVHSSQCQPWDELTYITQRKECLR